MEREGSRGNYRDRQVETDRECARDKNKTLKKVCSEAILSPVMSPGLVVPLSLVFTGRHHLRPGRVATDTSNRSGRGTVRGVGRGGGGGVRDRG